MSRFASLLLLIIYLSYVLAIKTCETFSDYYKIASDKCFDNPDAGAPPLEILRRWGCHAAEYNVTTKDGYQISIIRAWPTHITQPIPIVMGHGIYMNSLGFISMFNKTIAYNLIQEGYDVYLINFRGTLFSTGHTNMTQSDYDYWMYSFHEMGICSTLTALDLVARISGKPKSIYIGYSMGTTAMFVYSTLYPTEASERLAGVIALAPVANVTEIRSIVSYFAPFWRFPIKPIAKLLFNGILLPRNEAINRFCAYGPIPIFLCYASRVLIFGPDFKSLDPLYRPVTNINHPDVIAANVIEHYWQCYKTRRFIQYDHGAEENLIQYGSVIPPDYPIEDIRTPMSFFVADNDWIAEEHNALATYNMIPSQYRCGYIVSSNKEFSHDDVITSRYVFKDLIQGVLAKVQQMKSGLCS
ncbi:unnamed protein product [Phaedon cochleariae]|uniref:AB hydrolase-1 domain-containing protein n=1 Tax=Phaedon cochleariae TaxID=80249 RepID=A0A9N9SEK3_PHACE|nr:unnamed protein product [Phaedon cochleariae]